MKKIVTDGFAVTSNKGIATLAQQVIADQREILKNPEWVELLKCDTQNGQECGLHMYTDKDTNEHNQPRDYKAKFEFNKQTYRIITNRDLPSLLREHIERIERLYKLNINQMRRTLRTLDLQTQWRFDLLAKFNLALEQDLHVLRIVVYLEPDSNGELAKVHCDQCMVTCVNTTTHSGLFLQIGDASIPFHSKGDELLFFPGMKGELETGGRRNVRINCRGIAPILATTGGTLHAVEHWAVQPEGLAQDEYRGTVVFFGHSVRAIQPLSPKEIGAVSILK